MLAFPNLTLTAIGNSGIVVPYGSLTTPQVGQNNSQGITSLGLIVTVSAGASLTYTVQVTADPNPSAGGNWNAHEVLTNQTVSANSNILYPVSGVRLNVSSYGSGTVTLGVVQWP